MCMDNGGHQITTQNLAGIKIYTYLCGKAWTMEKIKNIWFDEKRIYVKTTEGRVLSRPLEAYPELKEASMEQRNDFSIDEDGTSIRWEELDADMHISSFYETSEPNGNNEVAEMFRRFPWLNVSEVARAIGINKSLLARYIYGISKPSEQRLNQIRFMLHKLGMELQTA